MMRTRKGLDWTAKFAAVAQAARGLPDCIIDGEVVALDHNGAPDFAALQAALSEGRSQRSHLFRVRPAVRGRRGSAAPAAHRAQGAAQKLLSRKGAHAGQIKYVEHFSEPGDAVLKSACDLNLEGIISKRLGAPYQSGRTETWHKSKCRGGQEVVIGGWSGSSSNLRSLLVGVYRGGHLVHTGRVGTGFNARNAGGLLKKLTALKTDQSPFGGKGAPRKKPRLELGRSRSWSPRSSSLAGPGMAMCGRRLSRACARTSPQGGPSRTAHGARRSRIAGAHAEGARQPHQGRQRSRHGRRRSQSRTSHCGPRRRATPSSILRNI